MNPAVIVLIVLLIIMTLSYSYKSGRYTAEMSQLRGFWETESTFNKESGLQTFTMYMGEHGNCGYPVYMLMVDNEENILINSPTHVILTQTWENVFSVNADCYEFNAIFKDLDADIMPNRVQLKYYPRSGKIVIYDKNTIYGCLFKNPVLSEMDLIKETSLKPNVKTHVKEIEDAP